ncbi:MAG TPA: ABC transporter [Kosmotogaceae bacterium]|nr:ABC transporter [Kosmotogaceae bacterium]
MVIAEEITKRYGKMIAVDSLTVSIRKGEIYGFLGPNGAGKTTTIKMLTGILRPDSGKIMVLGMDMKDQELEIKRRIGVVPEEPKMYENLRGHEFASFIMEIYGAKTEETKKRFGEICQAFQIDYLDRFISDYSHGMKQKLMVASTLMRQPSVLFLDEPTVGLDARSAKILKLLLRRIVDNGAAVFLTTHVLEIAEKMCDRIGIIDKGVLIAEGTIHELKARSKKEDNVTLEDLFLELTGVEELRTLIDQIGD